MTLDLARPDTLPRIVRQRVPKNHLLRRMNVFVTAALADLHQHLRPFYSEIGHPSVDPELMSRMLIVGVLLRIRHERRLCEEVKLHAFPDRSSLVPAHVLPDRSVATLNLMVRSRVGLHHRGSASPSNR